MGFNQAPALPYRNLGIVEDGDTASQAIEKDKYIIWKGQNYFAKTDILQGETFVVDTNLTAMPEGVINGIVDTLNASKDYCTKWKLGGRITSVNSYISYPEEWEEIIVFAGTSPTYQTFVHIVKPFIELCGNWVAERNGFRSSDYLHLCVIFEATGFKIANSESGGGNSVSPAQWYYR